MPLRSASIFGKSAPLFSNSTNDFYFAGRNGKINLSSNEDLFERSNVDMYESFHNDPIGLPIKSTQQIPVDWSDFTNHTFFNSAEANVNMAFNTLINEFPFDGSRDNIRQFIDSLTGFEKWIFDSFPKNKGYLKFDGNSYIVVEDKKGAFASSLSKNPTGEAVLNPKFKSLTFEFDLFTPANVNLDCATVCQKIENQSNGFSVFLSESNIANNYIDLIAIVNSGSQSLSASLQIERGQFHHIACVFNRNSGIDRVQIISGTQIVATSADSFTLGRFDFLSSNFLIGSGSSQVTPNGISFVPQQTLSGAIDDLRVFHEARNVEQVVGNSKNTVYPIEEPNLVFLHRYNEPGGNFSGNNIVLDSSGNGLHSTISNFSPALREQNLPVAAPLQFEDINFSPILFPTYPEIVLLNTTLLQSASNYDVNNPSLITRLIPRHLLLEASQYEGFENEDAEIGNLYDTTNIQSPIPGTGKIGSPQIISAFLFTFAKNFDEYKIFVDHFSKLLTVNYEENSGISDQLITSLLKYQGFEGIPFIYQLLNAAQYFNNGTSTSTTTNENLYPMSVKQTTAQIMRRVLINYQDIVRSKGTRHSIEALFRALGINPDTSIKIREFGGIARKNILETRRKFAEVRSNIDFSGSLSSPGTLNAQGFDNSRPHFLSPFLSGSRTEPGYPQITSTPNDGLFTTASFTVETLVKFPQRDALEDKYSGDQSVVRLHTTGSAGNNPIFNLVVVPENLPEGITGSVNLYGRCIDDPAQDNILRLSLQGVNIFDGNDWYLSFGRDDGSDQQRYITSSYFLRAGKNNNGNNFENYATSQIFNMSAGGTTNLLASLSPVANSSGSFIVVGSQSLPATNVGLSNTITVTDPKARITTFEGQFSDLRFWSKALTEKEFREHVLNPRSLGAINPLVNYNFVKDISGSFERLRLDVSIDQPVTQSSPTGEIQLVDFSQNFSPTTAYGFEQGVRVIRPIRRDFTIIEPRFDERSESNKVRIRSFQNLQNVEEAGVDFAPVHSLRQEDEPVDDSRLSIEVSIARALDEDIVNIFATLEAIEKAIGKPEALYSETYKELEKLRDVYFNRLVGKINFQEFFEIYNWFDTSIGQFIAQLLPTTTDFLGTNFVFESHMLERHKIAYKDYTQYLKPTERMNDIDEDSSNSKYRVGAIEGQLIG